MKELEKKLQELMKKGYETVEIAQVLQWIRYIKMDARAKRLGDKQA